MSEQNIQTNINDDLSITANYEKVAAKYRPIFEKIAEGTLAREQQRSLPYEQINWLKQAGFGALRVPVKFGGDGVSLPQLFQLLIELAKADSNIVQALRGHFAFVEDRLNAHKVADQALWFKRFVQGDLVGNAWTEIGQVKIGDVITRVKQKNNQLLVNGKKYYSTGTIFADWVDLFAYDETTDQHVIAAISRHASGVQVLDDWDGFGQKTTGSGTLSLTDVAIERDHILPFEQRFKYQTAFYQVIHLATLSGIAQSAVATFIHEVQKRDRIFSHGNADLVRNDPQILQVIGKASAQAYASETITLRTAEALQKAYLSHFGESEIKNIQANNDAELESAQGQVVISALVLELTSQLFNALGASASTTSKQLDRFWRNARVVSSHNPLVYKEKVIGDWEVNHEPLPFVWQIGASPKIGAA
ncbi:MULTISPECIES: acyl-CoA dehydrogenase family protein [Acinetobacter]|uniref:acyl-CoA dehydrogenase family protein n=1 Tax=Acinetobacter TaxID=469 RepID=UPI00057532D5|nr:MULTISPECIES: acyl-CoA dehydrogenase family protein [Acinetobacter]KKW81253.1 monooxygenase [Acinetobacter sp. Ag2]MBO3655860.1 acyl-CoA dehydrogenase family protein [Acinetobacter bereziniae]MCU4320230.1 acyl-CoA dehydrogenase family protein [Acinetobacter bereziniae]MCU4600465.1 acyl-CoA dehydrogenase family protein [Acinetobacter bereziniae]CEI51748.1 Acyl-CoA dehydrogenase family protein [Acinetobacter bereziniae]